MSMTVVNAKIYVARIYGGGASQEAIDMAGESILRAYQDWRNKKFWRFLLKDTSATTPIAITATKNSALVTAPTTGAFDFVNVGQAVTYSGTLGTLSATATIDSINRGTDGVVTSIELTAVFGGGVYTTESGTLTFSENIPILAGVNEYNIPSDYDAAYTARFLTNPRTLTWRDPRYWDRVLVDQETVRGIPDEYTTYNPVSELTQNFGTPRLKFDRIPDTNETLFLRYYRKFNSTGTNIDMPDDLLYQFLDYCRNILLMTKKAQDNPELFGQSVERATEGAAENDDQPSDDDDANECMKSQYEMGGSNLLWRNGNFDPFR